MAKIKNMGTATMRFKEGVIITGSAANPDNSDSEFAIVVSGSQFIDANGGGGLTIFKEEPDEAFIKFVNSDDVNAWNAEIAFDSAEHIYIHPGRTQDFSVQTRENTGGTDPRRYAFRIFDNGKAKFEPGQTNQTDARADLSSDVSFFVSGSDDFNNNALFGGVLMTSASLRVDNGGVIQRSGSQDFHIDADNEMFVSAGGTLSYKIKTDGNVEFQTAVTSSHFKVEGAGGQFVAFNEDTVKLKHVNWYSSNDRQYGQGQLWYQQWFGAIEPSDSGAQGGRRIGFFFYKPNKGASDADGGTSAHPTNTHMYLDRDGMYLQTGSFDITQGDAIVSGSIKSTDLGPENEIVIVGADNALSSSDLLTIDTANERIGIGTTSPTVKLDMVGEASGETQIRMAQHHNGSDGPDVRFFTSRGTAATPLAVANDDNIGRINSFAHNGTSYVQAGTFGWDADGTDGDSTFNIRTRVGGTTADRIEIDASGDVSIPGSLYFEDYIMAELSIPGLDIQADTNAYTFNCPYNMTFERMDVYLDTNGGGDLDVDMINLDDSNNVIFDVNNITNTGATPTSDTSASNANVDANDRIRFRIANVTGSPQGLRVNVRFRRRA